MAPCSSVSSSSAHWLDCSVGMYGFELQRRLKHGARRGGLPTCIFLTVSTILRPGAVGNATLSVEQQQTVIGRGWGQSETRPCQSSSNKQSLAEVGGSRKRDPVSRAATNSHWQRLGAVGNATLSVEQQQTALDGVAKVVMEAVTDELYRFRSCRDKANTKGLQPIHKTKHKPGTSRGKRDIR